MRLEPAETLAGAWAMFRRDRALLLGLAGPFWLLPILALRLLVPMPPDLPTGMEPGNAAAQAATQAWLDWAGLHGGWFFAAAALDYWGTLTLFVLYLDPARPALREALGRAARLWPRFFLLNAITALPIAMGLWLFAIPGLYVIARVLAAGPALIAEAPVGAWAAVRRGLALSRGVTLSLMALAAVTLGMSLIAQPLLMLDRWLRARPDGPNPVTLVMIDGLAAAIATAASVASALVAIAAYRRLARNGI